MSPRTNYSDNWPLDTQRRYHMKQRPLLIFWLLLAATLCVDAVVFARMRSDPFPALPSTAAAFFALIFSQLSVACIWSALHGATISWKLIVPLLAVVCAALSTATFSNDPTSFSEKFIVFSGYYGLCAAVLLGALWLLQRTTFWRRRSGGAQVWQFSLTHLLIVTTVVALLAAASRHTSGQFIVESLIPVALAIVAVVIWSLSWHWILRLAAVLGFAMLSAAVYWPITDLNQTFFVGTSLMIQGVVLSAWLAWGPILPLTPSTTASADAK